MKKFIIFTLALLTYLPSAYAQNMDESLFQLQKKWASVKYEIPEKQQKKPVIMLAKQAKKISQQNTGKAEPLIWQAIIISMKAGLDGGKAGLREAKAARELLLKAEKINPKALNGAIYTSLGALYYKVPGWPIGFGDKKLARKYLEKSLRMNPDGIDINYLYGEFLYQAGDYTKAKATLEHGLKVKPRIGQEVADKGRKAEIKDLLQKVNKKL